MVRVTRIRSLPLHFEASPLKPWVVAVGWPTAIVVCVTGIALFARAESIFAEAVAASLLLVGGSLFVVLVRCRRFEMTVGERMIELQAGPFRHSLPAGCVVSGAVRPATRWRRLFADREVELTLSMDDRKTVVPTRDEEELRRVLLDN